MSYVTMSTGFRDEGCSALIPTLGSCPMHSPRHVPIPSPEVDLMGAEVGE